MHSIIILFLIQAYSRNAADNEENVEVTGAATAACLKRRL